MESHEHRALKGCARYSRPRTIHLEAQKQSHDADNELLLRRLSLVTSKLDGQAERKGVGAAPRGGRSVRRVQERARRGAMLSSSVENLPVPAVRAFSLFSCAILASYSSPHFYSFCKPCVRQIRTHERCTERNSTSRIATKS